MTTIEINGILEVVNLDMKSHGNSSIAKRKYLSRYINNLRKIESLSQKIIAIDERITAARSPNYSGMPKGGTPVTIEDIISDKLDQEKRLERLKERSKVIRSEILECIDSVNDPIFVDILERHFIEDMSFEKIAQVLGYASHTVYEYYRLAIKEVTI